MKYKSSYLSALREEKYGSAIALIKALEENSTIVKVINLKSLIVNVPSYYEPLTYILSHAGKAVARMWSQTETWSGICGETHFWRFLAITMRAIGKQDWFDPNEKSKSHSLSSKHE